MDKKNRDEFEEFISMYFELGVEEILKGNIAEFKQILEKIQTEDDIEKYKNFDIEKGLDIIELH